MYLIIIEYLLTLYQALFNSGSKESQTLELERQKRENIITIRCMFMETGRGRYESSEGRTPRGGDAELYLKYCIRFHQSGTRVQHSMSKGMEGRSNLPSWGQPGAAVFAVAQRWRRH